MRIKTGIEYKPSNENKSIKQNYQLSSKLPIYLLPIFNNHGGKGESLRGQIPINNSDIELIPEIVNNYDNITTILTRKGLPGILYEKTLEDGTTVYVEEIHNKHKELTLVSMRKIKRPTLLGANQTNELTPIPSSGKPSTDKVSDTSSPTQENDEFFRPEDRNAEWTEGINPELQEKYGKKNRYKMWQGVGQITQDNVASALYVESGIYSNELRKLPKLFVTNEGRLVDPQATILGAQQRIEILNEYKAMIAEEMMPKATKPAQEYMQKEIDRLDETIDYLNEVVANPEAMARDSRRIGNSYLLRPEEEENTTNTFTSVAQSAADRLGIEIEIDEGMPAKGSYNPRTGRVRVNPTRHATAEDVQRTILHEVIGHGGIQAVMGDQFGKMCGMAYELMSEEQRADFRKRHGNLSNEALGAEYIAEMAEKGEYNLSTWAKIKGFVRNYMLYMRQWHHA